MFPPRSDSIIHSFRVHFFVISASVIYFLFCVIEHISPNLQKFEKMHADDKTRYETEMADLDSDDEDEDEDEDDDDDDA